MRYQYQYNCGLGQPTAQSKFPTVQKLEIASPKTLLKYAAAALGLYVLSKAGSSPKKKYSPTKERQAELISRPYKRK